MVRTGLTSVKLYLNSVEGKIFCTFFDHLEKRLLGKILLKKYSYRSMHQRNSYLTVVLTETIKYLSTKTNRSQVSIPSWFPLPTPTLRIKINTSVLSFPFFTIERNSENRWIWGPHRTRMAHLSTTVRIRLTEETRHHIVLHPVVRRDNLCHESHLTPKSPKKIT